MGLFILCVGVEGGQQHDTLCQACIKALHRQDAVHAVHAKPGRSIVHILGLGQDQGCRLIVHRQEHQVRAFVLGIGQLDGEVRVVAVCKGGVTDDFQAQFFRLFQEVLMDSLGIHIVIFPNHSDLRAKLFLRDILGGSGALVGVHKAHLEDVILPLNVGRGGSGGRQRKDAIRIILHGGGLTGLRSDRTQGDLHSPVLQGIVGVDSLFRVVDIVLITEVKLDVSPQCVDLVHCNLGAVFGGHAVDCRRAGQGTGTAQLESSACGGALTVVVSRGLLITAAGAQAQDHHSGQGCTKQLFLHVISLLFISYTKSIV